MSGEQKIRAFLFYVSLAVFLIGLPFILSFALGYKFDPRTLLFTKTGLIVLKTQPADASIYLNGALLNEKTPATINELLPGSYNLKIELTKYYPWLGGVNVNAGRVTRLEKVILFPLRPNVRHLNKYKISYFWLDSDAGKIYYINQEENTIYRSDLEGTGFERYGMLPLGLPAQQKYKISPDKEK